MHSKGSLRKLLTSIALVSLLMSGFSQSVPKEITMELKQNWKFKQVTEKEWLTAKVPGCVHTDLLQNGKIKDPFYRLNERDVQWIDKVDWEYKTTLMVSPDMAKRDRMILDFKGLDTYADIYVNEQKVLTADNMFRQWEADIKAAVKPGVNSLRIVFRSPIVEGLKKYNANPYVIPVSENDLANIGQVEGDKKVSVYTRKAGYHFGWDWGPRLVSSGIWRPVYVKAWNDARITDLHVAQNSLDPDKAALTANFEIEAEKEGKANIEVTIEKKVVATKTVDLQKGKQKVALDFEIAQPKLWWTNGLGKQNLYTINTKLSTKNTTAEATRRVGLRTLKLVRNKDDKGTTFYFSLNGRPVFMKGANYIPNDIFPSRVTEQNYRKVIETAKISNHNMLRVWGGGIYENDLFYDLCDENGILVWQDFMFACAMFPGDQPFLDNVKAEAVDNIKRIRNHPSLAMWCGNNEILAAWFGWGWKAAEEKKSPANAAAIYKAYEDIFHKILPDAVAELDPSRSYWDSSPSSGMGVKADLVNGDEHYWGVWWGKEPFSNYATHLARFMSEYGFQSFPEFRTVKQYAQPQDYDIFSEVMKSHQRSSIGNGTIDEYMQRSYRKPKDFESFLYVGQVLQAEGIKFAMEGHRRAMPYCMGSLYWQINDCWPVASWSSTDYYQRWKALQYFAKKSFEPVIISPAVSTDSVKLMVVNDRFRTINASIKLALVGFDGKQLWSKDFDKEISANCAQTVFTMPKKELLNGADLKKCVLSMSITEQGRQLHENTLYFSEVKDLDLPKAPAIKYTSQLTKDGVELTFTSPVLAKNVFLSLDDKEEVFFTDNYFDVIPGRSVTLVCKSAKTLTTATLPQFLNTVTSKLKIKTLDGTY